MMVAPSPSELNLRRSIRLAKPPNEMRRVRVLKDRLRVAQTPSVTKSNLGVETPKEMPLKKRLREAPTPGCKKEPMPLKETCVETPSVTMQKPKRLKMDSFDAMVCRNNYNAAFDCAKNGLELYHKRNKDAEFEIVRVLNRGKSGVNHSTWKTMQDWSHVCFIAKPKNSDESPKHFLVEMLYDHPSGDWIATYCDAFEPSDKPGFKHDCLICGDRRKTHPGPGGYVIGAPPYKKAGMYYGGNKLRN